MSNTEQQGCGLLGKGWPGGAWGVPHAKVTAGLQTFLYGPGGKHFRFYRPMVSVPTTQLCHCGQKAAIGKMLVDGCGFVPIKLDKSRQRLGLAGGLRLAGSWSRESTKRRGRHAWGHRCFSSSPKSTGHLIPELSDPKALPVKSK